MSVAPDFEKALRDALDTSAIQPVFQPIVHLSSRKILSFEVLARWTDPVLGVVSPATFIPALEALELIASMTDDLIRTACQAAKAWPGEFRLTFNISPLHFQDGAMPSLLENAVACTGFPLSRTQIEITESALLQDDDSARATMDILRSKGVHVLLDDFGTGYSSLARLRVLPFDKIKIDASFVGVLETSRDSRKIVSAIIGLGQSLGVPVIAEGVETVEQEKLLRQLGCDLVQGWLYSRPVVARDVPALLDKLGQSTWDPRPTDLSTNQRLAQLEVIYSLAPVGICFVNTALHILKVNDKWFTLMGVDRRDVIGQELTEVAPQIAGLAAQALIAVRSNDPVVPHKLVLADGTAGELAITATRDEAEELIGLSLMVFLAASAH